MMPTSVNEQAPVPPPSYHRRAVQAVAQRARALHINALTLIETLHLLALCRLTVQVAQRRCPPPLPKGAGGRPTDLPRRIAAADRLTQNPSSDFPTKTCMTGSRVGLR